MLMGIAVLVIAILGKLWGVLEVDLSDNKVISITLAFLVLLLAVSTGLQFKTTHLVKNDTSPLWIKVVNVAKTNYSTIVTYTYNEPNSDIEVGAIIDSSAKLFETPDSEISVKRKVSYSLYGDKITDQIDLVCGGAEQ